MLISFEGIDGSGKTTQIQLLRERLLHDGVTVSLFREPGGTEVSEVIRGLLLNPEMSIDPVTEVLLFSSARSQLIAEQVKPRLEAGEWVILDRFYDSTVAYQGYGRQSMPIDQLHAINAVASHGLVPDLTFYLHLSRETADARLGSRLRDRMEQAGEAFYDRVVAGFQALAASEPRFRTIPANQSVEMIHHLIWDEISARR
jgi:dTMP kinase